MSTQNTSTPWVFVREVERLFGIKFEFDLAADSGNKKATRYYSIEDNAIMHRWELNIWNWLNPPFSQQTMFINKLYVEYLRGVKVVGIWPLSSDSNQRKTWDCASVYIIEGRIWPLVRGCMLSVWDVNTPPKIERLVWDTNTSKLEFRKNIKS